MVDYIPLWHAFLIIGVFSYALWRESPYFRFCEHAFIASALGYAVVMAAKAIITTAIYPLSKGEVIYIVPLVLGFALYLRFGKSTLWISRWPIAIIVGVGMALGMRGVLFAYLLSQVQATATMSIVTKDPLTNFNSGLMLLTTILILMFFIFTFLREAIPGSAISRARFVSRCLIMLTLGAFFGSITMARLTLIAGQIRKLMIAFGLLPA
mgnify:CR=1 FL=1